MNPNYAYTPQSLPEICIQCGTHQDVALQGYVKYYTPPWILFLVFFGCIPVFIAYLLCRIRHDLTAYLCAPCWKRLARQNAITVGSLLGFLFLFFGGIFLGIALKSVSPALFGIPLAFGLILYGIYYELMASPKYSQIDRDNVVVEIPGYGKVSLACYSGSLSLK
jgi:hypothetical protein